MMSCPNFKVKVIKLHNTNFWCCERMKIFSEEEEFTIKEISEEYDFKYCPFCGSKIR
jgi:hypothetical protein